MQDLEDSVIFVAAMWDSFHRWRLRGRLLTTEIIRREYLRAHGPTARDFLDLISDANYPVADLKLSLDDFSRKQGWLK